MNLKKMVGTSPHGSKRSDGPYKILKGCGNGGSTHNVFGLWITKSEIQCCFRFLSSIFKTMKIARASQSASFCISGARKTCEMTSNNALAFSDVTEVQLALTS